ncbi:hypothetical protein [Streptomyces sp. NBC_01314]|uniref:hypothetical protein n=1 Tax=Streptomyces sp. NBC_01314 TaxID=2903821 RepID=UPI00308C8C25|nr:hypothetical protein OG622_46315 [Streptomyces sp. NBC_01314]
MLDRLLGVSPGVIDMTLDPLVGAPNGGVTTASWMTGAVHADGQLPRVHGGDLAALAVYAQPLGVLRFAVS